MLTKTENFDANPNWDGRNNRSNTPAPRSVVQNFGFQTTNHFAQASGGEVGGRVHPTGEPAYYAQTTSTRTFNDTLMASGKVVLDGGGNTLLGFFNSNTVNEWRNPNAVMFRLYGRGNHFLGYTEYGSSKWRIGANAFVASGAEVQFPINTALDWTLSYSPSANNGNGQVTATIGNATFGIKSSTTNLDPGHKLDTATFNRFGLGAVNKSYDSPGQLFIDNVNVNGAGVQAFTGSAPGWSGVNNNATYSTNNVRFRFDFGYSNTNHAGGAAAGEAGGNFFRGDSRQANTMAFYGDELDQTLSLNQPLHAARESDVQARRHRQHASTSDSSTTPTVCRRQHSSREWRAGELRRRRHRRPQSAEGFLFYPSYGTDLRGPRRRRQPRHRQTPYIYPDSTTHNWTLDYDPNGNGGTRTDHRLARRRFAGS